jgi:methanethiol S-methyltransferase
MITRILFFAYGCFTYVLFLATFLYAIGFIGGFAVPTQLDGPATAPFSIAIAIDILLLSVFALQHSIMARRWFKRWWTQVVPWAIERSTYVLFASLALDLLFWLWRPLGGTVWSIQQSIARLLVWAVFAYGWMQVLVMTFLINHFDLFGLRQVWLHFIGRQYTHICFATPAPYRFVRHPLYLGFLLAFWSAPTMTVAHLVFAATTTVYIIVAIQFEERDLAHEHGAPYLEYRRRIPMLFPRLTERLTTTTSPERATPREV